MFKHIPSNTYFDNRKAAVIAMGQTRYRRALKNLEFDFQGKYNTTSKKQTSI